MYLSKLIAVVHFHVRKDTIHRFCINTTTTDIKNNDRKKLMTSLVTVSFGHDRIARANTSLQYNYAMRCQDRFEFKII